MPAKLPTHSSLGASSAERWLNCKGSSKLINILQLPESEETDYQRDGTALHEASAYCLNEGIDSWEILDQKFHDVLINQEFEVV